MQKDTLSPFLVDSQDTALDSCPAISPILGTRVLKTAGPPPITGIAISLPEPLHPGFQEALLAVQ
jgi:hypothetical protein